MADISAAVACGTTRHRQQALKAQLHDDFAPGAYDNWVVWAGALSARIGDLSFDATLARAYIDDEVSAQFSVRVELFFGAVDVTRIRAGEVEARLWTQAPDGTPHCVPMTLCVDAAGSPQLCASNLVFLSDPVSLAQTGTFAYTVEFSADGQAIDAETRRWVALNDLAQNQDGVVVVSPRWVEAGPTMMEVCLRKLGARIDAAGHFHSGHIQDLTHVVADLPVDVIYLLPFFRPGFTDLHTGEDVRKGQLGSPYAVADFFAIDPALVPEPASIDLQQLLAQKLFDARDVKEIFGVDSPAPDRLARRGAPALVTEFGDDAVRQLVGRAHLRALTRRAHEVGKRVIFDLVLMQTSRDHELIRQHPEWYVLEPDGRPAIHRIAWLEYSDVALFDLAFNEPLQQYLLDVAPYWIDRCDLDGVRIDASQTVDRPFLARLHNRIHRLRPDALVLGETLCPLHEAVDIPVDMIYALLVDFHRDAQEAAGLIDFLERVHSTFAAGTVAKAYFENHDSPRASAVWEQRFTEQLAASASARDHWSTHSTATAPPQWMMVLAKNLQATLIDATLGMAPAPAPVTQDQRPAPAGGTRLAWALEWGSQWGETQRTDFEHANLLRGAQTQQQPGAVLEAAYLGLPDVLASCHELRDGAVYYHRHVSDGDRVLAATRYGHDTALLILHNLDAVAAHRVEIDLSWLTRMPRSGGVIYDSYDALHLAPQPVPVFNLAGSTVRSVIAPLQSRILRLTWVPSTEVSTTHGTVSSTGPSPGRHDPTPAASSIRQTNQENT